MKLMRLEVKQSGHLADVAYYHAHWTRQQSPLLDELGAVIDHVESFSAGGPDSLENLVTACNKCNAQKGATLAARFGERPRKVVKGKYGEPRDWDGLSRLFVALAGRYAGELTQSERDWVAAFGLTDQST
jgi:5-methylcytosine-specific restriction endonuclease McrA